MPLKPDDLKSVDAYKKAIKLDAAKISTSGGTKFWVYRDVELPSKQKLPALLTLIDDIAVKALVKGKPPVCRGTCGIEGGQIAFESSQGTIPYALLKPAIPLWTGKPLHIPSGDDDDGNGKSDSAPSGGPNEAQLNAAWKQLSQRATERMAAVPAQRAELTQATAAVAEMLRGGKLADARKRMDQLQELLKKAPPPDAGPKPGAGTPYPGLVKYRTALLQFTQAKSAVKSQIGGLRNAIATKAPEEKDFANKLAAELEELNDELAGVVDEAMKGAENEASPATDAIKLKIRKYQTELVSNPLVAQADSNPLVPVTIAKTLGAALARIRESMPA